ncbi:hypothetical protein CA13_69380 [Planctomycetes bacterium CA13]|uniref:Uncharacterized protein n=1 Tax=Novipirellula herctigrandis TaxID=2527986 RepID=A0A5C5YNH0_9BACT|nr:hypothetical protein CA13_69380 [Planctomycetes bacterium CA13]
MISFAAIFLIGCGTVRAQHIGSQNFKMRVPQRTCVSSPATISIDSVDSATDISFPQQSWSVSSNLAEGISVLFMLEKPFSMIGNQDIQADGEISVQLDASNGPATWSISEPTAATDIDLGDQNAAVQVIASHQGEADLSVHVRMLAEQSAFVVAGTYEAVLTCTVTTP